MRLTRRDFLKLQGPLGSPLSYHLRYLRKRWPETATLELSGCKAKAARVVQYPY
jgi:hypothetical protein